MKAVRLMTRYKAWSDGVLFSMLRELPHDELVKPRPTRFGNMLHTMNHVFVIDCVFKAHLLGEAHGFTARNTPRPAPLHALRDAMTTMDAWYVDYAEGLSAQQLDEVVEFDFIGGGRGAMTRREMLLHVVNHGTYHRGFVGDMLYQAGVDPTATDLTVFVRDVAGASLRG